MKLKLLLLISLDLMVQFYTAISVGYIECNHRFSSNSNYFIKPFNIGY